MTDHELNLKAAVAMGWKEPPLFREAEGGYRVGRDAKGELYIALVPNATISVWSPATDLNQAWELYTHVFHYDDSSDVFFDTVNRLFGCAVQHEGQVSPMWLSPEDFARALTEESVK